MKTTRKQRIEYATAELIEALGFSLQAPNFFETPTRVAEMWSAFTTRNQVNLKSFPLQTKTGLIIYKNHEAWSFCPHHLLPVKYTFKIGYLPMHRRVIGASKIPRLVNEVLRTLPLQEEVPGLVGKTIEEALEEHRGVGVIVHGEHQCTRIRGVMSPCLEMVNTYMSGEILQPEVGPTREEFMQL